MSSSGDTRTLVGRDAELAKLGRAASGAARVVCVAGPAGVGKTALVRTLLADREGVFCPVEGIDSAAALVAAVAVALSVPLPNAAEEAREERLLHALAARGPMLVVFDAAERSGALLESVLPRWSAATPKSVTFVVTSQLRLAFADQLVTLEPLLLPPPDTTDRAIAHASPAVQLFLERAASRGGFAMGESDVADVVAIVCELDGLPLALLLAAARVGLLGVARMRELLPRRFELLVGADAGGAPRHRSLEAAIAWSWDLLAEPDRRTLSRCAVFRGGFTVEAAQAVAAEPGEGELTLLSRLETLLATSMVFFQSPPARGRGARFALYESVRAYALANLDPALRAEAETRHAEHYLAAAEHWAERVGSKDGTLARRWLAEEEANVLAVCERPDVEKALRAAVALRALFVARGPVREYARRIEALLARGGAGELRARALVSLGLAETCAGQRAAAVERLRESLAEAEAAQAPSVAALAATKTALLLGLTGGESEAMTLFARAHEFAARAKDSNLVGVVAKDRGMVLAELGDNPAAIEAFHAALSGFRASGDIREEAFTLAAIGARYVDTGSLVEARRHAERALAMLEEVGDQRTQSWTLFLLALAAMEERNFADASSYADRALALVRGVGDRLTEGLVLSVLGHIALESARLADAQERYQRAAELLEEVGDERNLGIALAASAAVSALRGERSQAEWLLERARKCAESRGRPGDLDVVSLYTCVLAARSAEDAAARGDAEAARAKLDGAAAEIKRIAAPDSGVHRSDEVRLAIRVASRTVAEAEPRVRAMLESDSNPDVDAAANPRTAPFVVAEDGTWFRLPSGDVKKLRGRPVAARLLLTLVDRALASPGTPVAGTVLIAAGWPGEKILPAAAQNRLYVAMTRLRRLGLGELLRNEGDGYYLVPQVPVRIARGTA